MGDSTSGLCYVFQWAQGSCLGSRSQSRGGAAGGRWVSRWLDASEWRPRASVTVEVRGCHTPRRGHRIPHPPYARWRSGPGRRLGSSSIPARSLLAPPVRLGGSRPSHLGSSGLASASTPEALGVAAL